MQELIKVSTNADGNQVVSARDLYNHLEPTERFGNWMERCFQYGFTENLDYVGCKVFNAQARQELQDYALTLDCAKEISMIQRTEKGKQARQYFLECERRAKSPIANLSRLDMAKMILEAEQEKEHLEQQARLNAPKVLFADCVSESKGSILMKELAAYLSQNGVLGIGQNRLFEWMRENGYLCQRGEYYNLPTQRAIDMKLFEVKKTAINKPDGTILANTTTKVTGKGQLYFVNKFLSRATA